MGKIYVVGDLHSNAMQERKKCNTTKWPEQKSLTKDDVLIQLGDFGDIWYHPENSRYKEDLNWQEWWCSKPYTFLVVDGNHENHDMIDALPEMEKWGATVKVLKTKSGEFYVAKRGEIYFINGKKVFTMGGAQSTDAMARTMGVSWWPQEKPTKAQTDYAQDNLEANDNYVDIVLTHTMPAQLIKYFLHSTMQNEVKFNDSSAEFLGYLWDTIEFEQWHCGHFHMNQREYRRVPFYDEHGKLQIGPDVDNDWVECHYNTPPVLIHDSDAETYKGLK